MKSIIWILLFAGLSFTAATQKFYTGRYYRPRIMVTTGFYAPVYPPGWYGPYYPNGYGRPARETRLERKLDDIRADYKDRIRSARHDHSISRAERKKAVIALKSERDRKLRETKRNYYKAGSWDRDRTAGSANPGAFSLLSL